MTNWSKRRDHPLSPKLAVLESVTVVVALLAFVVQPGWAFGNDMLAGVSALRRASCFVCRQAATAAQTRHIAAIRCGSALPMAWEDDREAPPRRRQVDRGFSTGGVVDGSFTDSDTNSYRPRERGGSSGGRLEGRWANANGGGGGGRQQRFPSGPRGGGSGNYRGGGGNRGGGGGRYEQRGRGRGRGWDQAADNEGGIRGGARGGRGGYDRDLGGGESGGRSSSTWDDNRGRGRGRVGQGGRGRSSYGGGEGAGGRGDRSFGGREKSSRGRRNDLSGRDSADDGPSRAWTPASGAGGGYADEDGWGETGQGGEDEEGSDLSRSSSASGWMRGELSDYQAELSPNDSASEDMDFDMVYGIAPVLNVLRNDRREKLGLYCQDGLAPANKKDRAAANQIYDLAREANVPMTTTDKGYLNTLCNNRPHQGFILKARPLQFEPILFLPRVEDLKTDAAHSTNTPSATPTNAESMPENDDDDDDVDGETAGPTADASKKPPTPLAAAANGQVWLALDEVTDPQNFGALLRSAHFFGASGVVTCAKNSASLTATVSKSSAGAVEVMRIHSTANMMRFLKRSRENGWRVVGTSVSERSGPLHELPAGPGAPPTIVVLGNEGYGVRTNVLKECEFLVEVAGDGGGAMAEGTMASTVDSLNVSVTGGVVLFHLLAGARHAAAYTAAVASSD